MNLFPIWVGADKLDGTLIPQSDRCLTCKTNECRGGVSGTIRECSYGFDYFKVSDKIVFGLVVGSRGNRTSQKSKRLNDSLEQIVSREIVDRFISSEKSIQDQFRLETETAKEQVLSEYTKNEVYKKDFIERIKKDIAKGFSFFHDYRQINGTIFRNINVVLFERTGQKEVTEDVLKKCSKSEVAIYFASMMLQEKLITAQALQDPSWLYRSENDSKFRFHSCVLKYVRMYAPVYEAKKLDVSVVGHNELDIVKNPKAVSIIPHTLIDNAIKYAPEGSKVAIRVQDEGDTIIFQVRSLGPKIKNEERSEIFLPFVRGEAARKVEEDGAGFGLFVAQTVAKEHLGTEILVSQKDQVTSGNSYETEFSVRIQSAKF